MLKTPDLSQEFHPVPKPLKKAKAQPKPLKVGKKVIDWKSAREKLKQLFKENGITECEAKLEKCTPKRFLGFAHIKRRNQLTNEQIGNHKYVILACQSCHEILDFKMDKATSYYLMEAVIVSRGW